MNIDTIIQPTNMQYHEELDVGHYKEQKEHVQCPDQQAATFVTLQTFGTPVHQHCNKRL